MAATPLTKTVLTRNINPQYQSTRLHLNNTSFNDSKNMSANPGNNSFHEVSDVHVPISDRDRSILQLGFDQNPK